MFVDFICALVIIRTAHLQIKIQIYVLSSYVTVSHSAQGLFSVVSRWCPLNNVTNCIYFLTLFGFFKYIDVDSKKIMLTNSVTNNSDKTLHCRGVYDE